ncbi:M10 family metallopeptidase C-terminal domain-containing protein [Calothrix sp. PCC 6303]|uniref:M10 family metallopeptidase C-terminal domain-containing protein n=1 Tax=Calothrix sp. PCC 6303 TaxID=1170562 RepID=UPI0002A02076|nr:M10 family metallopeptidase C-terminal domain-containing protein [Calothrix sp. PCC 6303]AFZ01222.1 Serralysin [Calothrix sp. PCC 6303]
MDNSSNQPKTDRTDIKTLFFPGNPRWSSNTITYNFMPFIPGIYIAGAPIDAFLDGGIPDPVSFKPFDAKQKAAAQEALDLWAEFADIRFVQKPDTLIGFDIPGLDKFLDLGILKPILEATGKFGDFVEKYSRFVGGVIGAPLVNGADIRFGTANITGSGGAVPPYGDSLTQQNAIRDKIVGFVDDYLKSITDLIPIGFSVPNIPVISLNLDISDFDPTKRGSITNPSNLDPTKPGSITNPFNLPNPLPKFELPKASDLVRQLPDIKILPFGDLWLNKNFEPVQSSNIGINGGFGFYTVMHEIGHALGLKHPGNYDAGGSPSPSPYLNKDRDSVLYSIMSYDYWEGNNSNQRKRDSYPETPMLYDIAAIQALYGANFKTRSGNDNYKWDATRPFMATIWDGGGIDTINASNQANKSEINLNAGQFSSIGLTNTTTYTQDGKTFPDPLEKYNLGIAFGVTIENAIGGAGSDILIGNQVSNRLDGGASNDTFIGGAGADTLIGGTGFDTASYKSSPSGVTIDLVTGQGFGGDATGDTLQSIENLDGSEFNDVFISNADSNQLDGRGGIDTVSYVKSTLGVEVNLKKEEASGGFADADKLNNIENILGSDFGDTLTGDDKVNVLNGRGGNDILDGGAGKDTLIGGAGFDIASYSTSTTGITIDLSTGTVSGGDAQGDVLIEIEGIGGSEFSDTLLGDENDNTFSGLGGDDVLRGRGGNDQLNGGEGNDIIDGGADIDTARYDSSPNSVIVNIEESQSYSNTAYPLDLEPTFNIAAGTAFDGFGNTDTLRNLENITGSNYDDVLIGNALRNTLNGLAGNDLLIGNGGDDILDGGDGIDTVSYRRSFNSSNIGVSVDLSQNFAFDGINGLDTLNNIENVIGSQFADRLIGDSNANTILGGDGNDIIEGKEGSDRLFGENGNDEIFGGIGNDYLVGGTGTGWFSDILDGGTGNDTASYITATSGVAASLAEGTGWQGDATGDKFISIENLEGSSYNDFLIGDNSNNILTGLAGNDTLEGRAGDDTLDGGAGEDTLWGSDGNDILRGGSGKDTLVGDLGNDTLEGGLGDDSLDAGLGDDTLTDLEGNNTFYTGEGNNFVTAGSGNDVIYAGSGHDIINAGDGLNKIFAGEGFNQVTSGSGDDIIYAGSSRDIINAGNGNNQVYASEGLNDIFTGFGDDTIYAGSSNDLINAGNGRNLVYAAEGNNLIGTGSGNDTIYAGSGSDWIFTGAGDDVIYAAEGNNLIAAGTGDNLIYGGSGRDLFALVAGVGSTIIDQFQNYDRLGLIGGLSFDQLSITQNQQGNEFSTHISIASSGDLLASLKWVEASSITRNSFVDAESLGMSVSNGAAGRSLLAGLMTSGVETGLSVSSVLDLQQQAIGSGSPFLAKGIA